MPLIQISLREGRSASDLDRLAKSVTDAVSAALDAPKGSVRILVTEVPANLWFVGGEPLGPPTPGARQR